jgi:hypothetical protein
MNAIDQQLHQLEIDLEWELLWSIPDAAPSRGSGLQGRVESLRAKARLVEEIERLIERFNAINLSNIPIGEKQGELQEQITRAKEIQKEFAEDQNGVEDSPAIKSFVESLISQLVDSIANLEALVSHIAEIEKQASQCDAELKQLSELKDKSKQALFLEPKVYRAFAKLALLKQQFPEASPVTACEKTALAITAELNLNRNDLGVFAAKPQANWSRHILALGPPENVANDAALQDSWLGQLEIALQDLSSQGQDWEQIPVTDDTLAIIQDLQQKKVSEYLHRNGDQNYAESIIAFSSLIRLEQLYRQIRQMSVTEEEKKRDQAFFVSGSADIPELKEIKDDKVLLKWLKQQDDLKLAQRQATGFITQAAEARARQAEKVANQKAFDAQVQADTALRAIKSALILEGQLKVAQQQAHQVEEQYKRKIAEAKEEANQAANEKEQAVDGWRKAEEMANQAKREADEAKQYAGLTWARNLLSQSPQELDQEQPWTFYVTAVSLLNEAKPLPINEQAEEAKPTSTRLPKTTEMNVSEVSGALGSASSLEGEAN